MKPFLPSTLVPFFIFLSCFASGKILAQKPKDKIEYPLIYEAFQKLFLVYSGKDDKGKVLDHKKSNQYLQEVESFVNDTENYIKPIQGYPIVEWLFQHMLIASREVPDTMGACLPLKLAREEWERLDDPRRVNTERKKGIIQQYKVSFGLEIPRDIQRLYNSTFSVRNQIKDYPSCDFKVFARDTTITPLPISDSKHEEKSGTEPSRLPPPYIVRSAAGDMIYTIFKDSTIVTDGAGKMLSYGKTPAEAILRTIHSRRFKTRFLEIRPVLLGQFDKIPKDSYGTFYEILLRGTNITDTLLFGPEQYSIIPDQKPGSMSRWGDYAEAMKEFSKLLFDHIEEFGPEVFEFALIGSADSSPFASRRLVAPFNTNAYREIIVTNHRLAGDFFEYFQDIVTVGDFYDNNELPDLRAAYIREAFLDEPTFQPYAKRIRIVKGKVALKPNKRYRNCTILLYINRDLINGKFKREHDQAGLYSPFQVKT